jgi:3-dehydroquinate synthase
MPETDADRLRALLASTGLPTHLSDLPRPFSAERLIDRMADDKKAEGGALTLILARRIGEAFRPAASPAPRSADFLISEGAQP